MTTGGPAFAFAFAFSRRASIARSTSFSCGSREGCRSHRIPTLMVSPSSMSSSSSASVSATPTWRTMRWPAFRPSRTDSTSWTDFPELPGLVLTRRNMGHS